MATRTNKLWPENKAKTELAAEADTFYSPNIRKKEQKSMALDKKSLEKNKE
jgi:hypothetical protein